MKEYFSDAVLYYDIDGPRGCTVICPETGTRICARFSPYTGTSMAFDGGLAGERTIRLSGVDGDRINEMADLFMTALTAKAGAKAQTGLESQTNASLRSECLPSANASRVRSGHPEAPACNVLLTNDCGQRSGHSPGHPRRRMF